MSLYTLDLSTGNVTRNSDGKQVAPCNDVNDPDYVAYVQYANSGGEVTSISANTTTLIANYRNQVWEFIKAERDRRKELGVLVNGNWYHSDQVSRTQQTALVIMGANCPAVPWKTKTPGGGLLDPMYVTMSPALASGIFAATATSDAAIHAAEVHRVALLASNDPANYNFSTGWPYSFEDFCNGVPKP